MTSRSARRVLAAALLGTIVVVDGCATAPYTHRSQLILVSQGDEMRLGAQAFQRVVAKSTLDKDPAIVDEVEEVGRRLAGAADAPQFRWQFVVIAANEQNAFCLPGGKVAVYTGILPVARTTTGLAVVLGHEIAHALARHGAERMSQNMAAELGGAALSVLAGTSAYGGAIMSAYGLGAQVGVLLPYSRTHESEADHIGLILMAKAGYDPREAIAFWKRMASASRAAGSPEFLSTHPGHDTREQQIESWLPEAMRYYDAASRAPDVPLVVAK
jgi:predicted Zn-dependent protease